MSYLSLRQLTKTYPNGYQAVKGVSLDVREGEFLVFLGPSGCGKTTLLRMIAGLEQVTGGDILLDGASIAGLPPRSRGISMIFQSYAVWPHMTVYDNIAYPLRLQKTPKGEVKSIIRRVAAICQLEEVLNRYPSQLSGGQRQRVAVARAIAVKSRLFLMDEPLSNLDAKLRVSVRTFLKEIHREMGATTIFVTHDQSEAMALADRIAVIRGGEVEQVGSTMEVYNDCDSLFVANFMGTPPANLQEVTLEEEGGALYARGGGVCLRLTGEPARRLEEGCRGRQAVMAVRPEKLLVNGGEPLASSAISLVEPQGSHTILVADVGDGKWKVMAGGDTPFSPGDRVSLGVRQESVMFFDKETRRRIR